ncbi:hypothetical protein [Pseudonocardia pini]|uniref:hypothetical protein n=1 Tax=Pseudonocardia pini TaxID=2758030 RepID=UPI0015F030B5|nr:hypothetical protein [Pseudonocardia pini]
MTLHSMSLPAVLAGVARALREEVLPQVTDDYARMQVKAIAELMGNLVPRVTWDTGLVAATAERSEAAAGAQVRGETPEERLRLAREAVGALVDGLYDGDGDGDGDGVGAAAVRALVEAEFTAEEELVTTGSLKA